MENDYLFQAGFVAKNAWRLMALQDTDISSPSYGCFHYAYWRDKTSEFPDARFQEAGATLGILSISSLSELREESGAPDAAYLYDAFRAGLVNLSKQQYPEGCFDEWYKGERGIAATEFTAIAYGLAARIMGSEFKAEDRKLLEETLRKSGKWLATRTDKIKANHQAAIAAALALIGDLTKDDFFFREARKAMEDVLDRQQSEGWFPEIGGMDLGYCGVLLDYAMVYTHVTGDEFAIDAMRKLFGFMLPHIHPDGTISPEAGICLNPYVSRLGSGLLSKFDDNAASFVSLLNHSTPGHGGLLPYLADDLRFCRWSHLPLAALVMKTGFRTAPGSIETLYPEGWTIRKNALVFAYHSGNTHLYLSAAGGGALRLYRTRELAGEEIGITVKDDDGSWTTTGYDTDRHLSLKDNEIIFSAKLSKANYYFPGFFSRLILRIGCIFPWSSRLLRSGIDAIRLKSRSAVNQSAAPVSSGDTPYKWSRKVRIEGDDVFIEDKITGPDIQDKEYIWKSEPHNDFKNFIVEKSSVTRTVVYSSGSIL